MSESMQPVDVSIWHTDDGKPAAYIQVPVYGHAVGDMGVSLHADFFIFEPQDMRDFANSLFGIANQLEMEQAEHARTIPPHMDNH